MTRESDSKSITVGRFRSRRSYLADHCFLNVPGAGKTPDDVLSEKQWNHLTRLPTDVLLRTTDYLGSMLDDMLNQTYAWMDVLPVEPDVAPYLFEAALDAHDEFCAAPFIAAHGWYRQATASLRNALEVMCRAARFAVHDDIEGYRSWRDGSGSPPNFGNAIDEIRRTPRIAQMDDMIDDPGLFGRRPDGVMQSLYGDVCRYAHSQPGFVNYDIWKSNGPAFNGKAFTQFWLDYCDVLLACYILAKICYSDLTLPEVVVSIGGNAGVSWHGLAARAISTYFPA